MQRIVDDLNRLMAEEVEACLRYFQMRFRLRGKDHWPRSVLRGGDQGNARACGLDGQADSGAGPHSDAAHQSFAGRRADAPGEALAEALDVEQQALDAYNEFLPRVMGDPPWRIHPQADRGRVRARAGNPRFHECQVHRETRLEVGRDSLDYLSPSEGQLAQSLRAGTTGRARLTPGCMVCSPHRSWRRPFDHSRRSP